MEVTWMTWRVSRTDERALGRENCLQWGGGDRGGWLGGGGGY